MCINVLAQASKLKDKNEAKQDSNADLIVACFDLEEVLLTTKAFEASVYYKSRLCTYNFTIYNFASWEGHAYI